MFRHYNLIKNHPQEYQHQILNKNVAKVLLYGRRDKISIQTNRHIGEECGNNCQKCPKYVYETGTRNMLSPQLRLDIANNNSTKFVNHLA